MANSPRNVIAFSNHAIIATVTLTSDPALVDRHYGSRSWYHFERAEKEALAGIWEAEPHFEHVDCDYDELCHLLNGRARLTDEDGVSQTFEPSDSFVVAAGFKGTWENLTHVRKVVFIFK